MKTLLHSREVVDQGYPLAMVAYGINVLPPIKRPKSEYPDITQPLYADNAGVIGTYENIKLYFNLKKTPTWVMGIYLKPLKAF